MGSAPRIIPRETRGPLLRAPIAWLPILAAGFCIVGAATRIAELGPLSAMMAGHILVMNALAPLLALSLASRSRGRLRFLEHGRALAAASILQIAVLWSVHAPPVTGNLSGAAHLPLQAILFGTALLFWSAVFSQRGLHRWRSLLALLITGKLFCLLGVLLVFAPRLLYAPLSHGHDVPAISPMLADQQFAGLMMIVACPLSYVLAAILIAARWLDDISQNEVGPYLVRNGDR